MSNLDNYLNNLAVGIALGYLTLGGYAFALWAWDKYRYWRRRK